MSAREQDWVTKAAASEVDYEGFCDAVVSIYRKGVFQVHFGQVLPGKNEIRWTTRFWIDAESYKRLTLVFKQQLERYEKEYGEIKI